MMLVSILFELNVFGETQDCASATTSILTEPSSVQLFLAS